MTTGHESDEDCKLRTQPVLISIPLARLHELLTTERHFEQLLDEIFENACERCFDGEESAEALAIIYIRALEKHVGIDEVHRYEHEGYL
jgi:hypothetical protein